MNVLNNVSNKNLFVTLLLAGVVLSWIIRILVELFLGADWSIQASIISIIICAVCLAGYFHRAKIDDTGLHDPENLYYMGLLFTLASLTYSLITLFVIQGNDHIDTASRVHNLIGSFGIALISTFLGILLRILLMQGKQGGGQQGDGQQGDGQDGSVQIDPSTQVGLSEAAFQLRRELTQTIADMRVFRGAIVQATHETVDEASKACTALTQRVEETANEQTRILSTLATTTADKLAITLDDVTASVETVRKSLDDMADKQIKRTQQSIDLAEESTRELENGMQNSLRQIDQSTAEITTTFDTMLTPLQSITGNLQSTSDNAQNIFNQYTSLNSSFQQSLNFFIDIEAQMKQATNALTASTQGFSNVLADATNVTPQYTQQFEQLTKTLRQKAEQWQSMTQKVRSSLAQALAQAIDKLTQLVKRS